MTRAPSDPTVAEQVAALRPLLTQTLHAMAPAMPLVDCAVLANRVLDEATECGLDQVRALRDLLGALLEASERARLRTN